MKRNILCVACIVVIIFATSCAKNFKETEYDAYLIATENSEDYGAGISSASTILTEQEVITNQFPSTYSSKIGDCTFDINCIECPQKVIFHPGTVQMSDVDYEGLAFYYMQGKEYVLHESTGELFVVNSDGVVEYGASLSGMTFVDCLSPYLDSVRYLPEDSYYNLDKYLCEKSFSFGTAEECYSNIAEIYKQYGINIIDDVNVTTFYLDHEILAQEELHLNHYGEDDRDKYKVGGWSDEDDAYMFFINQNCQGFPDLNWSGSNAFWEGVFEPLGNASILIIYNKDGFVLVEARRSVAEYFIAEDTLSLLSFDDVANIVAEHLNSIIHKDKEYVISKARLYVSYNVNTDLPEIPLELHWAFEVTEVSDNGEREYELYFNAVTGEYEQY